MKKTDGKRPASLNSSSKIRAVRSTGGVAANGSASKKLPATRKRIPKPPPRLLPDPVTILEAKLDVGYGNTLFIRGEGAGLSWEQGIPMRCVDASTWVWSSDQVRETISFRVLFNDSVSAAGEVLTVSAGEKLRFTPAFQ
ncbi:MAG: hypothetical protein L0Z50_32840 [Verrucomicrobiales bacterium]|nr:hypothetical protein [Verrucomicrobiales bacterium]